MRIDGWAYCPNIGQISDLPSLIVYPQKWIPVFWYFHNRSGYQIHRLHHDFFLGLLGEGELDSSPIFSES